MIYTIRFFVWQLSYIFLGMLFIMAGLCIAVHFTVVMFRGWIPPNFELCAIVTAVVELVALIYGSLVLRSALSSTCKANNMTFSELFHLPPSMVRQLIDDVRASHGK